MERCADYGRTTDYGCDADGRQARGIVRRRPPPRRRLRLWRWLLALPLLALLLSAWQVVVFRFVDPWSSAFMTAWRLDALRAGGTAVAPDYRWRDLGQVSPALPVALVAAEDQKFPTHAGFDLDAIDRALAERAAGGRLRGASTISQQVAKNLFLWEGRSFVRKGIEAWYTVLIEAIWPKRRILEVYVNVAEFGDGIYGAEAAAQRFFGKPASALDADEAALLAAVLPNPKRFDVAAPSGHVRERQRWIVRQARQLGGADYLRACCG